MRKFSIGRSSRMENSKPKIAGSASQHVKSNFLSAFVSLIREIDLRDETALTMVGMYCIQDASWIAASK
jgi:hypothetical protein